MTIIFLGETRKRVGVRVRVGVRIRVRIMVRISIRITFKFPQLWLTFTSPYQEFFWIPFKIFTYITSGTTYRMWQPWFPFSRLYSGTPRYSQLVNTGISLLRPHFLSRQNAYPFSYKETPLRRPMAHCEILTYIFLYKFTSSVRPLKPNVHFEGQISDKRK